MSSITRSNRYQEGSIDRVRRAKGPDAWVFRWREFQANGSRIQRKRTIGSVEQFPKKADVKREVENLRSEINANTELVGKMTVAVAWGHFQEYELYNLTADRSPTTVESYLSWFKTHILPDWKDVPLDNVKAVAVERWLSNLDLANGSKAKIRNHLSALFSHCMRHELYAKPINPITHVRQSAKRERTPDILTIEEIKATLSEISSPPIKVMVAWRPQQLCDGVRYAASSGATSTSKTYGST
jgi:hypothetical protein